MGQLAGPLCVVYIGQSMLAGPRWLVHTAWSTLAGPHWLVHAGWQIQPSYPVPSITVLPAQQQALPSPIFSSSVRAFWLSTQLLGG